MAGKADPVNSIVDGVDGTTSSGSIGVHDGAAYASLTAAESAGAGAERGGWVADG